MTSLSSTAALKRTRGLIRKTNPETGIRCTTERLGISPTPESARTKGWTSGTLIVQGEYAPPNEFFYGRYASLLRPTSCTRQRINVLADGVYTLSFRYAHRQGWNQDQPIDLAVLVDDETKVSIRVDGTTTSGVDYAQDITLSAGAHDLCFTGIQVEGYKVDTLYYLDNVSLKFVSVAGEGIDRTLESIDTAGGEHGLYHGFAEGERVTGTLPSGRTIMTGWAASVSNETTGAWDLVASGTGNACDFTFTGTRMRIVWTAHPRTVPFDNLFVNGDFEQSVLGYSSLNGFSDNNGKSGIVPGWTNVRFSKTGGDYNPSSTFFKAGGKYVLVVQINASPSQAIDVPATGWYRLTCKYAHRSYGLNNKHYFRFFCDDTPLMDEMETPAVTSARWFAKDVKFTAGRHVFKIQGRADSDATTFFDDFKLVFLRSDSDDDMGGELEVCSPASIQMPEASGLFSGFAAGDSVALSLPTATVTDVQGNVWACTGWRLQASNEVTGCWSEVSSGGGTASSFAHTGGRMRFTWMWHPRSDAQPQLIADGGFEESIVLNSANNYGSVNDGTAICDSWEGGQTIAVGSATSGGYRDTKGFVPAGEQFIILRATATGSVRQMVNVPSAGTYTLSFRCAHRADYNANFAFYVDVRIGNTTVVTKLTAGLENATWQQAYDVELSSGEQELVFSVNEDSNMNDNCCFLDDISLVLKTPSEDESSLTIVGNPANRGAVDPAYGTYLGFADGERIGAKAQAEEFEDGTSVRGWRFGGVSGSGIFFSGISAGTDETLTWRQGKGGFAIILK